jgi:hypothetical protein
MNPKTKRLKWETFKIDEHGVLQIYDNDNPHDRLALSPRSARALRDFLNEQLGDGKMCNYFNCSGCAPRYCKVHNMWQHCKYGKLHGRAK